MSDVIRELFFPTPIYFCDVDNSKEINNKLIKNNTYQGNMAKMKFATWRRVDV